MEFKKELLPNDLTIIAELNESALSTAVGFFIKTGSRDETTDINGVSHFLEHMLFKGTEKLSAIQVNEAFDQIGAKFNAFTSEENTVFYSAVLPEYLSDVTDLWIQLMRPALRDEDFNIEKNVIKEEIAMYKDLPQFDVMDSARALHFKGHPCELSVLGTIESVDSLTAEQMRDYFTNRYAPDNIVVACCGNLQFDSFCELITGKCQTWKPTQPKRQTVFHIGSKEKQRRQKPNLVREHICIISPNVSAQDERRFAASLLAMILGDYTGSRFFWALVDKAIAETAATQYESMDGVGALYTYLRCDPQNTTHAINIAKDILNDLSANGVNDDELQKAKNKVLSALTIKSELPMGRLVNLGFDWIYSKEYRTVTDDMNAIKNVSKHDINALIKEFDPADFTSFALGPPAK
jgi:predicted Zn-dependent peptidase